MSPTMVWVDNRCAVQEFTRLELWYGAYHDSMYANPKVDPGQCEFGIVDWSNGPTWWPTNGGAQTAAPGVYDGPGHHEQAYVHDLVTDTWAYGPEN
ncbi:hypothetical protein ACFXHA_00120 [Nocardia sp. NPDC059240]|uniref:hypothetical protein n=1 Tax=Nocardia sp. NPDC059240 TaxID=3346786 RepID=UPI0036990B04